MRPTRSQKLFVRAFTEKVGAKPLAAKKGGQGAVNPSDWTIIFDTETTVDARQALRVAAYQVRRRGALVSEGLFYDPETLRPTEIADIESYSARKGVELGTVDDFRREVLPKIGFLACGTIVGFNLPFDISRIAKSVSEARGSMRGGFSFDVTPEHWGPKDMRSELRIRVKHLGPTSALIDFPKPAKQDAARSQRRRQIRPKHNRGHFVDLKTFASALTSRRFSLASLARQLKTPTQKQDVEGHGGALDDAYLDYARADVQATWECYEALLAIYAEHGLETPPSKIFSEASLGKAYLRSMGVLPLLAVRPDADRATFARAMEAYYGGRAEVRLRRTVSEVIYCDFKSMYPTVNALMKLHRFLVAEDYRKREATQETQAFLDRITLEDFRSPETWMQLTTLARIRPQGDVLPARMRYSPDKDNLTIGLNHITNEQPLWYTLADLAASKLLTGQTPIIEQAIRFEPGPVQTELRKFRLFGRDDCEVDPAQDDLFVRLINLRDEAKAKRDPIEKALKIVANSTCYGIFVEVNRDNAPKPEEVAVWSAAGECRSIRSTAIEEPGRFFHPLLATWITGAARLMLAAAERRASDEGLDYVFCDTDSIALARPDDLSREEFKTRAQTVIDWFETLNPYRKPGSILEMEGENFSPTIGEFEPLYCYAISAKRYALFNLDDQGRPLIRKASAHGLGYLMPPYDENDPAPCVPEPSVPLSEIGVQRWQHDFWWMILAAARSGEPDRVNLDFHPNLRKPALSRYGATSPALLRWMKHYNEGKSYRDQVKPFGFMVAPQARTGAFAEAIEIEAASDPSKRGPKRKQKPPKPVAPFERDVAAITESAFCRETGRSAEKHELRTIAEALALFHRSPEDKFTNGGPAARGRTERRHIVVETVGRIGKEANQVDEGAPVLGVSDETTEFQEIIGVVYGVSTSTGSL